MIRSSRQSALTLVEILAVLGIIAILFAIGVPAAKKIMESFNSSANVRTVIAAALSNARSIAMSKGTLAGVRFQQDKLGNQYMILIRYDGGALGIVESGFRAMEDRKPIKLPESIGVTDLFVRTNRAATAAAADDPLCIPIPAASDALSDQNLDEAVELTDTTTFSIVFSKEGRLTIHDVRVRNWEGHTPSDGPSVDDIFNIQAAVDAAALANPPKRMFYQDDYANLGLGREPSRNRFVIYDKKKFAAVPASQRWTKYFKPLEQTPSDPESLPWEYVNPNTGELMGLQ
jgi:type II secretory pathway pseudopilin PulG